MTKLMYVTERNEGRLFVGREATFGEVAAPTRLRRWDVGCCIWRSLRRPTPRSGASSHHVRF